MCNLSSLLLLAIGVVVGYLATHRRFRLPRIALYVSLIVVGLWLLSILPTVVGAYHRVSGVLSWVAGLR